MGIQLGTSVISKIFTQAYTNPSQAPISSSVVGLLSGSYSNGSTWTSTTGSAVNVVNNPLTGQAADGRWQFNGTDDYLQIPQSTLTAPFNTSSFQPFTFLFYGTIGDLTTNRALFCAGPGGYVYGGDAIFRTDTSPGSGKIHLDLRAPNATEGGVARFTITGTSGSLLNLAVVQNNNASCSVYQDGVLVATSSSLATASYAPWKSFLSAGSYIGYNNDTDTDNYNGQLGGLYLYNRPLTVTEISQSAQSFSSSSIGPLSIVSASSVYLGSTLVYPAAPIVSMSVQTLVIGGGGAGGVGTGGGGGAGGVVYSSSLSLLKGTYATNVGTGGLQSAGPVGLNASTQSGNYGQTSSFQSGSISVIAVGGGGGAAYETSTAFAKSGGSGGGGSNFSTYRGGGSGTTGQGNAGGTVTSNPNGSGAGGGGASQAGSGTEVSGRGAPGGSGSAYTIRAGSSVFYGGGGGAGSYNTQNGGLASAGGGQGGNASGGAGSAGTSNTGGGGGGSNRNVNGTVNGAGGAGGSGIIIIAYLTASFSSSGATFVSGGIITDYTSGSSGYRSHTFLSSSNFVIS
jgi:hypothetical protein